MNLLSLFLPMSYRTHLRLCWLALAGVWLASTPPAAVAQQQFQGLCAQVKIVILQELTLERVGFEATLEVTNNDGEDPITDFLAELTFENPLQSTNQMKNDASGLFFVRAPTLENVNSVNGDGSIGSTRKAVAKWFIIPKINAGGTSPNGVRYRIGARLSGKLKGVEIPSDLLFVIPDDIFVKPEPQLEISYFQPRDVQGDDPFTDIVESPIPFTIGVLVKNSGFGYARQVKINSQQPKIVENKTSLLLIAQLLGSRVMDSPLQNANLLVNLGDIAPGETRKGAWDMITSLSGEFVEFKASYTHASDLGGEETSVIKSLDAHFIAHEVLVDLAGRDSLKDFLADTDRDENMIPDAIYESQGNILPVNLLAEASVVGSAGPGGSFQVQLNSDRASWGYMRLPDPGQARLRIASIVRQDGKVLNTNNYWTNIRYTKLGNQRQNFLNILDLVDLGACQYTVTYAAGGGDLTPPVTTMYFAGSATAIGGKTYVTPDTQIYFLAEDESPVSISYSLTNSPFLPAIPFQLVNPGEYQIVFYSIDSFSNREENKTNIVVVAAEAPALADVNITSQPIFVPGDALSIRPDHADFAFQAQPNPTRIDATVDIFQGVVGWVTVSGVPVSPTPANAASVTVAGDHVDFYQFKLDASAWSAERPASQPILLSGLGEGWHTLAVLGRSRYGGYLSASNAVLATWRVDATAPATLIAGVPATPSRQNTATLLVSSPNASLYRWTVDRGYYRAEAGLANPITLGALSSMPHVVAVIVKTNNTWQSQSNATEVAWTVDPMYGADFSSLTRVRSLAYTNIGASAIHVAWNGQNDAGTVLPPGWYTIRLSLYDELGRTNFTTRLVQIGEFAGAATELAGATRGPKSPYARGHWTVWQDRQDGNWQIYAQDLAANAPIRKLTDGALSQENPRTDGRYVVWQGRQMNGNWDLYVKDIDGANPPEAVLTTPNRDEINPAIEWPWVVYQVKSTTDPSAPSLVHAFNLATRQSFVAAPSAQDQLNPDLQGGRVVWQDWRDVGPGEIYYRNLESAEVRRVTTNTFGQYHPAIYDHWIVWQDNRHGQVDLYGFDLLRNTEVRLTSTPEDETRPFLQGPWAVCEETSLGPLTANLRLVHLASLRTVPLTRSLTQKARPALAANRAVWLETENNLSRVVAAEIPALQPVFNNRNAIAVTETMVNYQRNAYGLLAAWQSVGVREITRYTALVPQVASETATLIAGQPSGPNFDLAAGAFLWVKFDDRRVLDLGLNTAGALDFGPGLNVFSYAGFPSAYTAYQLLRQLGLENVRAVRMLDAESGRWAVAQVMDAQLAGQDFAIPPVAVLLLDLANPITNWKPQ